MESLFRRIDGIARPSLRLSLGAVIFWIGALKFVHPEPVVELLGASLPFLAFPAFVYLLGAVEVAVSLLLLLGVGLRWAGLACMGLFAGTLTIFLVAPAVSYGGSGFPHLTLAGEFLLKDLVLLAASMTVVAQAPAVAPRHAVAARRAAAAGR